MFTSYLSVPICVVLTSRSSIAAREYPEVGVQYVSYVHTHACVCAISKVPTRRTDTRRTCDMESRRGVRISKPPKLGRAPISLPHPQCTCRNCESIRQEFATFGMQRGAFLSSLRTLSQHPFSLLRRIHRFRFIPVLPTTCHLPPPLSLSVGFPLPASVVAVADTKGRQKAIGANGVVARTRRPFD